MNVAVYFGYKIHVCTLRKKVRFKIKCEHFQILIKVPQSKGS